MRIIAGSVKGRQLKAPKGQGLRPTAARVKEALFNILPHDLSGLRVLDLFAGTGNLSVEALSRGAAEAVLIDADTEAGILVVEHSVREKVEKDYAPLRLRDQRRYGTTLLSFFEHCPSEIL